MTENSGVGWIGVRRATRQKTGTTINGPALRWVKRHCSLLSTLRALNGNFDPLTNSRRLGRSYGGESFVLGLLAGLATFGFVLEALVMEEGLFAPSPDKVLIAVYTLDGAVEIF